MATQDSRGIITRRTMSSESKAGQCFMKLERAKIKINTISQTQSSKSIICSTINLPWFVSELPEKVYEANRLVDVLSN
jgi:hypothetical protein